MKSLLQPVILLFVVAGVLLLDALEYNPRKTTKDIFNFVLGIFK